MTEDAQKTVLLAAERALQSAQRASDVGELDRLLHPELLAVGPDGRLATKEQDLAAHREGVFRISALEELDLQLRVRGETAVTFVLVAIRGTIGDVEVAERIRYTRTWVREGNSWRVFAAHISPMPH